MSDAPSEDTEVYNFTVTDDASGRRLDVYLAEHCADISRTRIKDLIKQGEVLVNDKTCSNPSHKLKADDALSVIIPEPADYHLTGENIPLDILFEDDDLLVINKSADMVVHPGAGNWSGTLVHALLHHCGDSLSGISGVLRPGIVHRLDKGTSGVMLAVKTDQAHRGLSQQLADRSLSRTYLALVLGIPVPPKGIIDAPIGRHPRQRLKMSVRPDGKHAVTHYHVIDRYHDEIALVECKLESGRTHQIRVHMAHHGYELLRDPLYGSQSTKILGALRRMGMADDLQEEVMQFNRQTLHAAHIRFIHPVSGEELSFDAPIPDDMQALLKVLK